MPLFRENKKLYLDVQRQIASDGADAWIIYGYKATSPTFSSFFSDRRISRRAFYVIPARGEPRLIVHSVDADKFADVPRQIYGGNDELRRHLLDEVSRNRRVLMEYSPLGAIPALSSLDAGTYELLSGLGFEILSSKDVHQKVFARWTQHDLEQHARSASVYFNALQDTLRHVRAHVGRLTERDVVQFLSEKAARDGVEICVPCVAVNEHSGMPSYALKGEGATIKDGDLLFIDCHARTPGSVFSDITWISYLGREPPAAYVEAFEAVRTARQRALDLLRQAYRDKRRVEGWELDRVARDYFGSIGKEAYFTHRLGHSLGKDIHGPGANLDDFESHDTRELIPGTAFTIEPGLYFPEFGVRTEINVYISENGPEVLTPEQSGIQCI